MLPKPLMKFRRNGAAIKPLFIDAADPELLGLARQLLELYRLPENPAAAPARGELEEMAEPLLKGWSDAKLAAGLHKLVVDRCKFTAPPDLDYTELRRRIFRAGAELLKTGCDDLDSYRARARAGFVGEIYRDLPQNEKLCRAHRMFAGELLERYNCAQVQSLLLYCTELNLRIEEHNPAAVRRLFKYLKFFRLLAEITRLPGSAKERKGGTLFRLALKISGPASLFENTRKYAVQLASFFPAVCDLEKWTVVADLEIDKRQSRLRLTEESGLVGHYRNFSAYVPEEITMFHRLFREKSPAWEIVGDSPFFNLGGQELVFPDLSFRHPDGRERHLELFHRWHSGQLLNRLAAMAAKPEPALIIGVDRALSGKSELRGQLDGSAFFRSNGFEFRDFPGVDRVMRKLNES